MSRLRPAITTGALRKKNAPPVIGQSWRGVSRLPPPGWPELLGLARKGSSHVLYRLAFPATSGGMVNGVLGRQLRQGHLV